MIANNNLMKDDINVSSSDVLVVWNMPLHQLRLGIVKCISVHMSCIDENNGAIKLTKITNFSHSFNNMQFDRKKTLKSRRLDKTYLLQY